MSVLLSPAASRNPFEIARSHLIRRLLEIVVPKNPGSFWLPSDFEAIGEHIKDVAEVCDEWLAAIGHQVEDNAHFNVDGRDFDHAFEAGTDDARYECRRVAERMVDERSAA